MTNESMRLLACVSTAATHAHHLQASLDRLLQQLPDAHPTWHARALDARRIALHLDALAALLEDLLTRDLAACASQLVRYSDQPPGFNMPSDLPDPLVPPNTSTTPHITAGAHYSAPDPVRVARGTVATGAAKGDLDTNDGTATFFARTFRNHRRPRLFLTPPFSDPIAT